MSHNTLTTIDRGQRFGLLTTVEFVGSGPLGRKWLCRCDCGGMRTMHSTDLMRAKRSDRKTTCTRTCTAAAKAWKQKPRRRSHNFKDLSGTRYGALVIVEEAEPIQGRTAWLARCDCGRSRVLLGSKLYRMKTDKCRCNLSVAKTGARKRPEYPAWNNAKSRCLNPKNKSYADYGGRGIAFHPAWMSFDVFFRDVGPKPSKEHSLDRIDPNGNYEPGNVRWATRLEQNNNKRLSEDRVRDVLDQALAAHGESDALRWIRLQLLGA